MSDADIDELLKSINSSLDLSEQAAATSTPKVDSLLAILQGAGRGVGPVAGGVRPVAGGVRAAAATGGHRHAVSGGGVVGAGRGALAREATRGMAVAGLRADGPRKPTNPSRPACPRRVSPAPVVENPPVPKPQTEKPPVPKPHIEKSPVPKPKDPSDADDSAPVVFGGSAEVSKNQKVELVVISLLLGYSSRWCGSWDTFRAGVQQWSWG